ATTVQKYVVPAASIAGVYEALVCPATTGGGGLVVPNWTSYVAAPVAVHMSVGVRLTPAAASGRVGAAGVLGAAMVVNDQTGPVLAPPLLRATMRQKYVAPAASGGGEYDAVACPTTTCGGGLVVPNCTSYIAAPAAVQVTVGVRLTP